MFRNSGKHGQNQATKHKEKTEKERILIIVNIFQNPDPVDPTSPTLKEDYQLTVFVNKREFNYY